MYDPKQNKRMIDSHTFKISHTFKNLLSKALHNITFLDFKIFFTNFSSQMEASGPVFVQFSAVRTQTQQSQTQLQYVHQIFSFTLLWVDISKCIRKVFLLT